MHQVGAVISRESQMDRVLWRAGTTRQIISNGDETFLHFWGFSRDGADVEGIAARLGGLQWSSRNSPGGVTLLISADAESLRSLLISAASEVSNGGGATVRENQPKLLCDVAQAAVVRSLRQHHQDDDPAEAVFPRFPVILPLRS